MLHRSMTIPTSETSSALMAPHGGGPHNRGRHGDQVMVGAAGEAPSYVNIMAEIIICSTIVGKNLANLFMKRLLLIVL